MRQVSGNVVVVDMELVVREQHERTEVGRPPDPVSLQVVEDVADGHVVGGEQEFALGGFPDGDSPIADQAAEAVGLPAIEGGGNDGDVGRVGFEIAAKIGDQGLAIVEAAVPGDNKTAVGEMRLRLLARFGCCVEGAIKKRNGTIRVARFAVGALWFQELADVVELFRLDWPAVEIPDARLYAHSDLLIHSGD